MIDKNKITSGWIKEISEKNNKADILLIEKVIHALLLVEGLVKQNFDFILKGGTSLMLILGSTKRFSIDIDIIMQNHSDNLLDMLNKLVTDVGFNRVEQQNRGKASNIDKEHYKFFYNSHLTTNEREDYVLLDIIYEDYSYSFVNEYPIESKFAPSSGSPIKVKIPSPEDLLGDKLTAFAPNTIGIPYFKGDKDMSMEIVKQLFDIGNLFDLSKDLKTIKSTFEKISEKEILYRKQNLLSIEDILDDIFQTALCLSTKGKDGKGDFLSLQSGINRIRSFIFSEKYYIDKAIISSSKTAYLSVLLQSDDYEIEKYPGALRMDKMIIDKPLNSKLNKYEKNNPEAFFYWYKIYELMTKNQNND